VQEDRNESDLLGDSQNHLEQIGRPPGEQPPCPAGRGRTRRSHGFATHVNGLIDQGPDLIAAPPSSYQAGRRMSRAARPAGAAGLGEELAQRVPEGRQDALRSENAEDGRTGLKGPSLPSSGTNASASEAHAACLTIGGAWKSFR